MTHRIVLRDAARIVLPFSLFVGFFSHGAVSVTGYAICALCALSAITNGLLKQAPAAGELEGA